MADFIAMSIARRFLERFNQLASPKSAIRSESKEDAPKMPLLSALSRMKTFVIESALPSAALMAQTLGESALQRLETHDMRAVRSTKSEPFEQDICEGTATTKSLKTKTKFSFPEASCHTTLVNASSNTYVIESSEIDWLTDTPHEPSEQHLMLPSRGVAQFEKLTPQSSISDSVASKVRSSKSLAKRMCHTASRRNVLRESLTSGELLTQLQPSENVVCTISCFL